MTESLRTVIHEEVVSVQPAATHIEYSLPMLNIAAHLGRPPHERSRQLEVGTIVHKYARLVDEHPNGISNVPDAEILFWGCLDFLLLPLGGQGL